MGARKSIPGIGEAIYTTLGYRGIMIVMAILLVCALSDNGGDDRSNALKKREKVRNENLCQKRYEKPTIGASTGTQGEVCGERSTKIAKIKKRSFINRVNAIIAKMVAGATQEEIIEDINTMLLPLKEEIIYYDQTQRDHNCEKTLDDIIRTANKLPTQEEWAREQRKEQQKRNRRNQFRAEVKGDVVDYRPGEGLKSFKTRLKRTPSIIKIETELDEKLSLLHSDTDKIGQVLQRLGECSYQADTVGGLQDYIIPSGELMKTKHGDCDDYARFFFDRLHNGCGIDVYIGSVSPSPGNVSGHWCNLIPTNTKGLTNLNGTELIIPYRGATYYIIEPQSGSLYTANSRVTFDHVITIIDNEGETPINICNCLTK